MEVVKEVLAVLGGGVLFLMVVTTIACLIERIYVDDNDNENTKT